jgi:A/G-specific adenine glycosylase
MPARRQNHFNPRTSNRGARGATRSRPGGLPPSRARQVFRQKLLAWYGRYGRDLPWRRTRDPYRVLVSEVMLQQTQVDRVLPKYHEWLEKFPTLPALAAAPLEDAVATWYPLGYNIRPRRLHAIARESVDQYDGTLPGDVERLRAFKGIGAYTAGAVMSFAFGGRAAILDTNVARLLFRVFVGHGNPKSHAMRKRLWAISEAVLPRRRVFDFNQALMDFGALVCTARRPRCLACPLAALCVSFPAGRAKAEGLQPRSGP